MCFVIVYLIVASHLFLYVSDVSRVAIHSRWVLTTLSFMLLFVLIKAGVLPV